jgi:hypothetical protein
VHLFVTKFDAQYGAEDHRKGKNGNPPVVGKPCNEYDAHSKVKSQDPSGNAKFERLHKLSFFVWKYDKVSLNFRIIS